MFHTLTENKINHYWLSVMSIFINIMILLNFKLRKKYSDRLNYHAIIQSCQKKLVVFFPLNDIKDALENW